MPRATLRPQPGLLLSVGGRRYGTAELLNWEESQSHDLDLNAIFALEFAQSWLRGDQQFALHTSGSTGLPKPILLTRSQMEASALATGAALSLREGQQALVCLPARYVAGRMMLVRGLVLGLDLHVVEPSSDPFAELQPDVRLDFAAFVPLQMQTLLDAALVAPGDSCFADDTALTFRYRRLLEGMRAILIWRRSRQRRAVRAGAAACGSRLSHLWHDRDGHAHRPAAPQRPAGDHCLHPAGGYRAAPGRAWLSCDSRSSDGRGVVADQRHCRVAG